MLQDFNKKEIVNNLGKLKRIDGEYTNKLNRCKEIWRSISHKEIKAEYEKQNLNAMMIIQNTNIFSKLLSFFHIGKFYKKNKNIQAQESKIKELDKEISELQQRVTALEADLKTLNSEKESLNIPICLKENNGSLIITDVDITHGKNDTIMNTHDQNSQDSKRKVIVHCTDYFPRNNIILSNYDGGKILHGEMTYHGVCKKVSCLNHRHEVHFTINNRVETTGAGEGNWDKPTYIHVAMVLGEDGTKLSKRNGDASFMDLYEEGYLPEAIVNYLSLLGWSPENNQEVFSMQELIHNFDEKRISKSSSQYDVKKLQWFNHQYIKNMADEEYLTWVKKYFTKETNKDETWLNHLLLIYKNGLNYGQEINTLVEDFLTDRYEISTECQEFLNSDSVIPEVIRTFKQEIINIDWTVENISEAINKVKEKLGVKGKLLFMPIRIATSGIMHGPELADTIYLLGYEKVMEHLNNYD